MSKSDGDGDGPGALDDRLRAISTSAPWHLNGPGSVKVGVLSRPLLWVVGAPHDRIASRADKLAYGAVALLMLVVASVAGVLMSLFVLTITGGQHPTTATLVGIVWGVVILGVDRSILTMRSGEKGGRVAGFLSYGVRIALAVVIAVIVGETALLQIFSREIAAQATANTALAGQDRVAEIRANARSREAIDDDAGVTDACDDARRTRLQKDLDTALRVLSAEESGVRIPGQTSGEKGTGLRTKARYKEVATTRKALETFDKGCATARKNANTAWTEREAALKKQLADIPTTTQAAKLSWTEQEKALDQVMAEGAIPAFARSLPWLLRLGLLLIDLLPILAKLGLRSTSTEAHLRAEAELMAERRKIWKDAALDIERYEASATATQRMERIDAERMRSQWEAWRARPDRHPDLRRASSEPPARSGRSRWPGRARPARADRQHPDPGSGRSADPLSDPYAAFYADLPTADGSQQPDDQFIDLTQPGARGWQTRSQPRDLDEAADPAPGEPR